MRQTFTHTQHEHQSDRFGFAVVLAVVLHAMIIFGVGFKFQTSPQPSPSIEVTLAQHRSDLAPDDADFLAQQNQQGSGESRDREEITTDRISELEGSRIQDVVPLAVPLDPVVAEVQPKQLLTADNAQVLVRQEQDSGENPDAADESLVVPSVAEEIASLRAKLDRKQQEYSKIPRVLILTAASARAAEEAAYLRSWIELAEKVGNSNYPEQARSRKIFGSLRLSVVLLPDGSVESMTVLDSSGSTVLDQAAMRTVRLAEPFERFPPSMREWDKLEIIRTWHYVPGNQLHTRAGDS